MSVLEEEDQMDRSDICSQINLISSIQYQKNELSKLATLLQSETDREKYTKVIQMSLDIQTKLDVLEQKKNNTNFQVTVNPQNSFGQQFTKKNSMWSLSNGESSSSRSSYDTVSSGGSMNYVNSELEYGIRTPRYHTYSGHTYRVIDKVTSIQFRQQGDLAGNKKPYIPCNNNNNFNLVKPTPMTTNNGEDSEEEEEIIRTASPIHIAVRRDASLFRIEKVASIPNIAAVTIATTPALPSTIPVVQPKKLPSTEKKRVSFSDEKKSLAGLITPPDSPQTDKGINGFAVGHSESFLDLGIHEIPQIMHVHKKTHQSLKGLLKRTYQLNQYTVSKTNSVTLPHSTHGELLYKIIDSLNGKHKFLLKIIIVSLDKTSAEKQRRFGFTFWWQNQYNFSTRNDDDDAKFALAPDSLVKEALITWITLQNEVLQGGRHLLPHLAQSDEILRDGRKLYVVYDTSLFHL